MSSVNENPESAHRSKELATTVWLVKNADDLDAVIVSFMDPDSEDPAGIYLYEPGADPVELNSVRDDGHGTVEVEYVPEPGDEVECFTWPGHAMAPTTAVGHEVSRREEAESALEAAQEDLAAVVKAVRDVHDEGHSGTFQWCDFPVCEAARVVAR